MTLFLGLNVERGSSYSIGANTGGIASYMAYRPFVDIKMMSRTLGSATSPWDGNPGSTDANGWPSGDFGLIFMDSQIGSEASGGKKINSQTSIN